MKRLLLAGLNRDAVRKVQYSRGWIGVRWKVKCIANCFSLSVGAASFLLECSK